MVLPSHVAHHCTDEMRRVELRRCFRPASLPPLSSPGRPRWAGAPHRSHAPGFSAIVLELPGATWLAVSSHTASPFSLFGRGPRNPNLPSRLLLKPAPDGPGSTTPCPIQRQPPCTQLGSSPSRHLLILEQSPPPRLLYSSDPPLSNTAVVSTVCRATWIKRFLNS